MNQSSLHYKKLDRHYEKLERMLQSGEVRATVQVKV
jgi:hypothetical protein